MHASLSILTHQYHQQETFIHMYNNWTGIHLHWHQKQFLFGKSMWPDIYASHSQRTTHWLK